MHDIQNNLQPTSQIKSGHLSQKHIPLYFGDHLMRHEGRHRHRQNSIDFLHLNEFKIENKMFPHQQFKREPQMMKLAYTIRNNIICDSEGVSLLKKYREHPIAFIGIYGKSEAGKSFWCEKVLNLTEIEGKLYSKKRNYECLQFFGTPFSKKNIKIFLLDCTGFESPKLSREEQLRLDLLMFLCSAIILIPEPEDHQCQILDVMSSHFVQSSKRLRHMGSKSSKEDKHWPKHFYCLFRSPKQIRKQKKQIEDLFQSVTYSIIFNAKVDSSNSDEELAEESFLDKGKINPVYMERVSLVFHDIYEKIQAKSYGPLKSSGWVMNALITEYKNNITIKEKVSLEVIVDNVTKKLYAQNYKEQLSFYEDETYRNLEGKLMSMDQLMKILKTIKGNTYKRFYRQSFFIDPSSEHAEEYEMKLERQIYDRQKVLIETKRKKAIQKLKSSLYVPEKITSMEENFQFLEQLQNTQKQMDYQDRSKVISEKLKEGLALFATQYFKMSDSEREIMDLTLILEEKKEEFRKIKSQNETKATKKDWEYEEELNTLIVQNSQMDEMVENPDLMIEKSSVDLQEFLLQKKEKKENRLQQARKLRDQAEKWLTGRDTLRKEDEIKRLIEQIKRTKDQQLSYKLLIEKNYMVGKATKRQIGEKKIKKSTLR